MKFRFFAKRALAAVPYTAGEQPQDKKYIKLNTNENPYPPSPAVREVLRSFSADDLRLYPNPNADGLRNCLAREEGVAPENVFCGNGSDEVLYLSFAAFFDENRSACFPDITYSFYEVWAEFFGVPVKRIPLNGDFTVDLRKMRDTACAGYYLANPNAPTGVAVPLCKMEEFVASVPEKIVVVDEAYMDFYKQSCAPLTKRYPNLLVVKTFSKSYSLAGIRCGYAVGDPALIEGLSRMKDCMNSYPVDMICEAACVAAIGDRRYHEETVALVVKERERLANELRALGFTVPQSGANFLFAGRAAIGGKEIYTKLKEAGILVRFWDKPVLRDFCRITVGTREQNDVLVQTLKKLLL